MEGAMSRHYLFNPEGMAPATGFSYGAVVGEGKTLYIAGMTGHYGDLTIDEGIVDQFARACESLAKVIVEGGGEPSDLVSLTIYTSDMALYRDNLKLIGEAWRATFGKEFPPMALIGISELFDPKAVVELVGVAVVP